MIKLEKHQLSPNGKFLQIGASIENAPYYDNMHISQLIVDTDKTYLTTGPSTTPLFQIVYDEDTREINEVFDTDSIDNNLFFIYIIADGELGADTPCDMKDKTTMAVAFNKKLLYKEGSFYLGQVDGCTPSPAFIDYILRTKAFETALRNCNYVRAIELWNSFFKKAKSVVRSKCGCHG